MSQYDDTKDTLLVMGLLLFAVTVMVVLLWMGVTV